MLAALRNQISVASSRNGWEEMEARTMKSILNAYLEVGVARNFCEAHKTIFNSYACGGRKTGIYVRHHNCPCIHIPWGEYGYPLMPGSQKSRA